MIKTTRQIKHILFYDTNPSSWRVAKTCTAFRGEHPLYSPFWMVSMNKRFKNGLFNRRKSNAKKHKSTKNVCIASYLPTTWTKMVEKEKEDGSWLTTIMQCEPFRLHCPHRPSKPTEPGMTFWVERKLPSFLWAIYKVMDSCHKAFLHRGSMYIYCLYVRGAVLYRAAI